MTIFALGNLTISTASQGAVTVAVPNYNETLTNTQAQQLADAIALCLCTASVASPYLGIADIIISAYPVWKNPAPWPGVTFQVTGSNPVFTLNLTPNQARQLTNALSLYTVTYQ
jgi:hypothetical protein